MDIDLKDCSYQHTYINEMLLPYIYISMHLLQLGIQGYKRAEVIMREEH